MIDLVLRFGFWLTVAAMILLGVALHFEDPVTAFDVISACVAGCIGSTLARRD